MSSTEYIDLNDAIDGTGLSQKTLERFSHSGLISSEESPEGLKFSKDDLERTFGVTFSNSSSSQEVKETIEDQDLNSQVTVVKNTTQKDEASEISLVDNLKTALDLQERLLDEKDSQLNEKTNEIKWLRQRIEKLEDQSEKDKILMLTSNKTLNQLIETRSRKSIFQKLLGQ